MHVDAPVIRFAAAARVDGLLDLRSSILKREARRKI